MAEALTLKRYLIAFALLNFLSAAPFKLDAASKIPVLKIAPGSSPFDECGNVLNRMGASVLLQNQIAFAMIIESPTWKSKYFSRETWVKTPSEVRRIVDSIFDDPKVQAEVESYVRSLGGLASPRLWDEYFKSYDRVVGHSKGYQDLVWNAAEALAGHIRIGDYGTGTGNFSAGMLLAWPIRHVTGVDVSDFGLEVARRKIFPPFSHVMFKGNLSEPESLTDRTHGIEGAIMNNVLYTIPAEKKIGVLRRVFDDLVPGGIFVLNDPTPVSQSSLENSRDFIVRLSTDAISDRNPEVMGQKWTTFKPITEMDIALVAAVNRYALINGNAANRFATVEDLRTIVGKVGFEIIDEKSTYYDRTHMFILKKPGPYKPVRDINEIELKDPRLRHFRGQ